MRTGETYVFDLPFHVGNGPVPRGLPAEADFEMWADFVTLLREELCVKANKTFLMRSWDSFPSDASWYLNLTSRIDPHPLLYFSIKHTPADFVRPSRWNPMLGVGAHAQVVEIELQREYEGKQAYPNYIVDGVIDGFPEMDPPIGVHASLATCVCDRRSKRMRTCTSLTHPLTRPLTHSLPSNLTTLTQASPPWSASLSSRVTGRGREVAAGGAPTSTATSGGWTCTHTPSPDGGREGDRAQ